MSYILDALKKADAEREQGGVPGLHSQPLRPAPGDDDDEPSGRTLPIVWLGAGVALSLIVVLSWQLLKRDAQVPDSQTAALPTPEPVPVPAPTTMPAPAPVIAPEPSFQAAAPRTAPATTTITTTTTTTAAPPSPAQATQRPADAAPRMPSPSSNDGARGVTQARPPEAANPAGQRLPMLQELPEEVRREIPQLTIGGAMYSETPTQRMLIINSQVFREGDQPYQGLALEEIRLKSAVFKYRGHRYSVNY